jgi:inosine/xanthosine triphosphatase
VGSTNPVKLASVQSGLGKIFPVNTFYLEVIGVSVDSGVASQPMSSSETRKGATIRAKNAFKAYWAQYGRAPDLSVGLEGGLDVEEEDIALHCFAWVVVYDGSTTGESKTASFRLPEGLAILVRQGEELGNADAKFFQRADSGRGGGTVGHLTRCIIDRAAFYEPAVILAYVPFMWAQMYIV